MCTGPAQGEVEDAGEGGADGGEDGLHPHDRADALLDEVAAVFGQDVQLRLGGVAGGDGGEVLAGAQGVGDDEGVGGVGLAFAAERGGDVGEQVPVDVPHVQAAVV
jgi:hypothetical protein